MSQSPELAGGAGFTFEDAVAASYLSALLQEGYAPGIENRIVCRVALQQRDFGEPLDDVIVDFRTAAGETARLSLQVKRSLTISSAKTNTDFRDIIRDSWNTLAKPVFRKGIDRYGAAVGEVAAGKARDLRSLCEFARASADTADFEVRFAKAGNASAAIREIRDDIVALIEEASGSAVPIHSIHQFFAHFVLIDFDFLHEGSTSLPNVLNLLRTCLATGEAAQAPSVWTKLCRLAREGAGRSRVFHRPHLVRELATTVRLAAAPSLRADLEKLTNLIRQWLDDIEDDVGGTRLDRVAVSSALQAKLASSRLVQIRGLPGSGKSVLLRRSIEAEMERGSVLLLKSGRLEGSGWASFANAHGLSAAPLPDLLVDVAATGSATLYIDGIDRIEKKHQPIIRDVVRAVLTLPLLDNWRIVVSLRDTGIEPLRNWLGDLLTTSSIGTVEVEVLSDDEAEELAKAKPHLRALLFGPKQVREIVRRPFFAKVLNQNFGSSAGDEAFAPQSEVDLIGNWWARGGYDSDGKAAMERQRAIIEMGSLRARHLERDIAIGQLTPATVGAVDQLIADGICQHVRRGHTLRFSHDIFFEWAFFHVLVDRGSAWLDEIRACGEPPAVARVVELMSQWEFVEGSDWAKTLQQIDASQMRSQWTRAWLLAPLAASNFEKSQAAFSGAIQADKFHFLKKALVWFQAERTTPNPSILASNLPQEQRIRFADFLGWPSDLPTWARFISFLLGRISTIPVALYPNIVSVFEVWQNALSGLPNLVSNALLEQTHRWLGEIEQLDAADSPTATPSPWGQLDSELDALGQRLAALILRSAASKPELAKDYLSRVIASERIETKKFAGIVGYSPTLAMCHPGLLVDLTLNHLEEELPEDRARREREKGRRAAEYRKRVLAKPPEKRTRKEELVVSAHSLIIGHSVSYHDWDSLSIDRDKQNFWPPSPLREPFHSLFKSAPEQALRLVAELSNHAITSWRQLHRLAHDRPGTPVPLKIAFPWGSHQFWGGHREYLWWRGIWAPDALSCGYMALEDWALAEVDRGRPIDELVRQIVTGNECVAVLGIVAALALHTNSASEAIFPFVTSQWLLAADQNRLKQDLSDSTSNLIGFRHQGDLPHVEAIKAANARPIRKKDLRWLVSSYFLGNDSDLSERTKSAILNFPNELPYLIEEHQNDPGAREYLTQQALEFAELVQIENYKQVKPSNGADQIAVVHVSPSALTPEKIAEVKEAGQRLREGNLWAWAHEFFESGELGAHFTIKDALEFAKSVDSASLYESGAGESQSMRRGAVAATGAVVLHRREGIAESDIQWAREVLARATHAPEKPDGYWSPSTIIPWHHAIFAARGLTADIRHGTADNKAARTLLELVSHPLEQVSLVALKETFSLWDQDPRLGWCAFFLALSLCSIPERKHASGPLGPLHTDQELNDAVEETVQHYEKTNHWPDLPLPPPAWVKIDAPKEHATRNERARFALALMRQRPEIRPQQQTKRPKIVTSGLGDEFENEFDDVDVADPKEVWSDPTVLWHSQYAAKVLEVIPYPKVLQGEPRAKFLELICGQLAWTIAKLSPPWVKPTSRDRYSPQIFEWTHQFGQTLGHIAGHCSLEEATARFLEPIFALDGEHCWELLGPLVNIYICAHVYDTVAVPADAIRFLGLCLERLLKDKCFDPASYRAGEFSGFDQPRLVESLMFVSVEHAPLAARYVNGDWSDIARIMPVVNRFVRSAGWASTVMSHYLTLCERSKASYPANEFADQVLDVIGTSASCLKGWHGSFLPARIAGLVQYLADRETPMPQALGQKLLRILDFLVDMGDRRSAALQLNESFREIQIRS